MKKARVCTNCGNKYTTSVVKVYVFKRRFCPNPKCKKYPMFAYNEKGYMRCGKCGLKVNFSDDEKLAEMGLEMKGATRDSVLVRLNKKKGLEVQKSLQPKHRVCQHCRNFRKRIENMVARKEKKSKGEVKEMSDVEILRLFHGKVQQKIRQEQQEAAKKKAEEDKYLKMQERLKKTKEQIKKPEKAKKK